MAKKSQEPGGEKTRKPRAASVYMLVRVDKIIDTGTSEDGMTELVKAQGPGTYAVALARRVIVAEPATGVVLKPADVFAGSPSKPE